MGSSLSDKRRSSPGPVQRAARAALRRAVADGHVDAVLDGALAAAAVRLAEGLDHVDPVADAYGAARLAKMILEISTALRLSPVARGAQSDPLAKFLQELSQPAPGEPPVEPMPTGQEPSR